MSVTPSAGAGDAERLRELGYEQELRRGLRGVDNVVVGFAAISPVVALYGVVVVGMAVAGGAWLWMLPVALAGQCLLLAVYAELASEFPVANGAYQWTRRLVGVRYAWFNGWVVLCAYAAANTTIAYLEAPWALVTIGVEPTANAIVVTGMVLIVVCALVNARGVHVLRRALTAGIAAEVVATVGVGVVLLLAFREQDVGVMFDTFGAESLSGGSTAAAMLAALAVAGWVFLGFDACGLTSEETVDAARHVPRAVWTALLLVAGVVILNAVAVTLAHPDPAAVAAGSDADPVGTAVAESFGSWASRPFAALTLIAFLSCGMAAQGITARAIFSVARDGVLPASGFLRTVNRSGVPIGATVVTAVLACAGMLLGLDSAAIGSVIAFGTAGIYAAFLMVAVAALAARLSGRWRPGGHVRLGRWGIPINVLAVGWLAFETVNIAWPRTSIAPPGAPWYQVWAAPLLLLLIAVAGIAYMVAARPWRRVPPTLAVAPASE
ncbi:MAG: APC family permease [Thermoleophilia bacterium]